MQSVFFFLVPPLQNLSPWVGLRKINVSYWGWEDMSPFTNTSLRWLPGEPSDSGFCAYLERAQVTGLKANPCTASTDGLICEKPAGEELWGKQNNRLDKDIDSNRLTARWLSTVGSL